MDVKVKRENRIIDANNRILGRLAVEIAYFLQGKHRPDFVPYHDKGDFVIVKNASKIKLTGKKTESKIYYHHSGYMGGLKKIPFKKVFEKDPCEILKKAVWGMLPKNKLREQRIKRLKIKK